MFPHLFTSVPWCPRHHFSAVFPALASLAVLRGLLPSWSTGTCPIQVFISWELHSCPCPYLSKSIKSACDCTWHLWSGLDVNPWGKAACELFNPLSIPGPCIKSIKQHGTFSCFKRRSVSALLELSKSWVFWARNFISLFQIHWSAITGDQCKQCLLPGGPEIFLINLLFSSLLSLLLFSTNLALLDETGWGNAGRIILWLGHLALKSGDQC